MEENLKKEIKEKYFQALFLQKKLLSNSTSFLSTENNLIRKKLEYIDDFFRHLTDA